MIINIIDIVLTISVLYILYIIYQIIPYYINNNNTNINDNTNINYNTNCLIVIFFTARYLLFYIQPLFFNKEFNYLQFPNNVIAKSNEANFYIMIN